MASRGRPKRLDDNGKAELCHLIERGLSIAAAARLFGCAPNTIRNTAGRDPAFRSQLEDARQRFVLKSLDKLRRTARSSRVRVQAAGAEDRRRRGRAYTPANRKREREFDQVIREIAVAHFDGYGYQ